MNVKNYKHKILAGLILCLFFASCSTTVRVMSPSAPKFQIPQGRFLYLTSSASKNDSPSDEGLKQISLMIDRQLRESHGLMKLEFPSNQDYPILFKNSQQKYRLLAGEQEKNLDPMGLYLKLSHIQTECSISDDITEDHKRNVEATCQNSARASLLDGANGSMIFNDHSFGVTTYEVDTAQMPGPPSSSSLRPLFESVFNIDSEKVLAMKAQDESVKAKAKNNAYPPIGLELAQLIIPNVTWPLARIDTESDDLKPMKKMVQNNELIAAIAWLEKYSLEMKRADIWYNLGILYQTQGDFSKACAYLDQSIKLSKSEMYWSEQSKCHERLGAMNQIKANLGSENQKTHTDQKEHLPLKKKGH